VSFQRISDNDRNLIIWRKKMSKEVTSLKQKDNRERKAGKAKDKGMSFNELF